MVTMRDKIYIFEISRTCTTTYQKFFRHDRVPLSPSLSLKPIDRPFSSPETGFMKIFGDFQKIENNPRMWLIKREIEIL